MADRVTKVTLLASVGSYVADMDRAAKATGKTADEAAKAARAIEEQNGAMRDIGAGLVVAGTLAVAATTLAVKAAIDWETAWAGVTKTVEGTPAQMAELEDSLRSLATSLPATHQEIAAVAEAAGQLGVQRENVAAFTETMIALGETTNLSADEAATSIAQLMNVLGTAPDQVDNLGAALVALGNDGASTERDIVQMAQRIAGAGRIVGLTEGEVLGFANALASVGIEAEAGGSAISRIMTDIAISVSEGGDKLDKFAAVAGLSATEFQKAFGEKPAEAIATFVEGLGRIDAAGGNVFGTLEELGQSDIRVSQALLGMANSGDLLRESLELGNSALEENTALTDEAAKRYETTAAKLQVVGNKINDAAIDFGDVFLPAITAAAEAVGEIADGFRSLSVPQQEVVAGMVTLATVAALAGGGFLLIVPKIAQLQVALGVLATSSMPGVSAAALTMTGAMGKAGAAAGAAARFLVGPWGLALAAAAVGVAALQQVVDNLKLSTEEFQNLITTGPNAKDLLDAGDNALLSTINDTTASVEEFKSTLDLLGDGKDFLRGFDLPAQQLKSSLAEVGVQLAETAASDLPAAQDAFRSLADEFNLTAEEQLILLNNMPALRDALTGVATDSGQAATDTNLLELAMGDGAKVTDTAAEAYKAAAGEAKALQDEIRSLLDTINESNGVGQDAVSTNAKYQAALAGISDEVERQKEAFVQLQSDAYEQANGTLDGFVGTLDGFSLSLDESTEAGSANAAMLSDVAADAQAAAEAQYLLDVNTMGGRAAAEKLVDTLAESKQSLIDQATESGFAADSVQVLTDKVYAVPEQRAIDFLVETSTAIRTIENFQAIYGTIQGSIVYRATREGPGGDGSIGGFAEGGLIPGAPSRKDNVLIRAATGEFITPTAQAAIPENRAALEYIRRGGVIRGYADGGFVQPQYASNMSRYSPPGGGGAGIQIQQTINPSQGMSEAQIARIAAERLAFAARGN